MKRYILPILLLSFLYQLPVQAQKDTTKYYYFPSISNILNFEELPSFLQPKEYEPVFNDLFYQNYQSSYSTDGSQAAIHLDLVCREKLKLRLGNTDIFLMPNPNNNGKFDILPLIIDYNLKALQYVRHFDPKKFKFTAESLYEMGLQVTYCSPELMILIWSENAGFYRKPNAMVQQINKTYHCSLQVDTLDEDNFTTNLSVALDKIHKDIYQTVYDCHIKAATEKATIENIGKFFSSHISSNFEEYIRNIVTPEINVESYDLSPIISFPTTLFKPADSKDTNSTLLLNKGRFEFNTKEGITFRSDSLLRFTKSVIGKRISIEMEESKEIKCSNPEKEQIHITTDSNRVRLELKDKQQWKIVYKGKFTCYSKILIIKKQKKNKYIMSFENITEFTPLKHSKNTNNQIQRVIFTGKGRSILISDNHRPVK